MIDPVELVEALLDDAEDYSDLRRIQSHLGELAHEVEAHTLLALVAEDDEGERIEIIDLHLMWFGRYAEAHRQYANHLRVMAQMGLDVGR